MNPFSQEKVCSSDFMSEDLDLLTRSEIKSWLETIKQIDSLIDHTIESNLGVITNNKNQLTSKIIEECTQLLEEANITRDYDLKNLEIFHGYRFYNKPDNGKMQQLTNNKDAYYGIARTTKFGVAHKHFESDAFNLILEGEGIFTGDPVEKNTFKNFYHGDLLLPGKELEIEIGMTHGHLVKKGSPTMWIFAYQHCGFGLGLSCEGDFHEVSSYDTNQFGSHYE